MTDFWRDSGFHLLRRNGQGRLEVTDDFLRAYFERPEIAPVAESNGAERALHASLLQNPRRALGAEELGALEDPDAQENYGVVLAFRDLLLGAGTVEECYFNFFTNPPQHLVPPLFIDQLAHVILRNILDGTPYPMRARAAEIFFREQRVSIQDGAVFLADKDTVDVLTATGGFGELGRLLVESQTPLKDVDLDVLNEFTAQIYWNRSEKYDTVLDLSFASAGLDAFARVMEAWVQHFLTIGVRIQPVQKITDEKWVWHTGLDAVSTEILNDLYNGEEVDESRLGNLLSLFRLEFKDPSVMRGDIAGRPVYLGLAKTDDGLLRMKPQNLLVNLPLKEAA